MNNILLSYTTINDLYQSPHSFINKQLGIKKPTNEYMEKGKKCHEEIQNHLRKTAVNPKIQLDLDFTTIEYHCRKSHNKKYVFHGYCDAVNFASKTFLEIKSVNSKLWGNSQLESSMQPRYYSWVTGLRKMYLYTCLFDYSQSKLFYREFTDKDWEQAKKWAEGAVDIIEKGDLRSDLVNNKCNGICPYKQNCHFL